LSCLKNANKRRIKNTVAQVGYNKVWIPVLGPGIFSLISFTVPEQTSICSGSWFRNFFIKFIYDTTIPTYSRIRNILFNFIYGTRVTCSCRHAIACSRIRKFDLKFIYGTRVTYLQLPSCYSICLNYNTYLFSDPEYFL
jgi:hypothetical protein